jgi:hypothetical protein
MKSKTLFALVTLAALASCKAQEPVDYIQGTVIKEFGNVPGIVQSSGALFGNESVRVGPPAYGIEVETQVGNYTIEIVNDTFGSTGPKTIYNLAMAIEVGTQISFPTRFENINDEDSYIGFTKDRVGGLDPDDISILR